MSNTPFPEGKLIAVVTSWDGGTANDRLMCQMLEKYGYKGTFYVQPEKIGTEGYLSQEALKAIVAEGHEIGSQSLSFAESKARLEALLGVPILSCALPEGQACDSSLLDAARAAGYNSLRTTAQASVITLETLKRGQGMPFPVTAYFIEGFMEIQTKWVDVEEAVGGIFHLWGHPHTLGQDPNDWVDFECNLGFLGGMSNVWYGTVGELVALVSRL